jgi:fatty acid/phospholipid biosynthesis enzyme
MEMKERTTVMRCVRAVEAEEIRGVASSGRTGAWLAVMLGSCERVTRVRKAS